MSKMIARTQYRFFYKDRTITGIMEIDLARFEAQYTRAQYELDTMVMMDMIPYMPMQTGTFIQVTQAMSQSLAGSGIVVAAAPPMGRFLYEGMTMVDETTGSPWARKGARKVLVSEFGGATGAQEKLKFSHHAHPKAQDHWFRPAKKDNGEEWVRKTKAIAGGGPV